MSEVPQEFGQALDQYLHANGYTREELAHAIGLHPKEMISSQWERIGFTLLTREEIERIIIALVNWHILTKVSEVQQLLKLARLHQDMVPVGILNRLKDDRDPHIRILEEPLTAQNLLTILSALIELSTKYWLIVEGRFADLVEYTQTHNGRFAEEAHVVITKISYNSPFNMEWKVDLSAPSIAEALVTTIDGITQRQTRLEKAKLENQEKALAIKEAEQRDDRESQKSLLELEQQQLELEQRRLEILEKQLEIQKKGIEFALEIAGKVVDLLHPGADPATRAMEIQTLLPNIIQLQNGRGLELALPPLGQPKK